MYCNFQFMIAFDVAFDAVIAATRMPTPRTVIELLEMFTTQRLVKWLRKSRQCREVWGQ